MGFYTFVSSSSFSLSNFLFIPASYHSLYVHWKWLSWSWKHHINFFPNNQVGPCYVFFVLCYSTVVLSFSALCLLQLQFVFFLQGTTWKYFVLIKILCSQMISIMIMTVSCFSDDAAAGSFSTTWWSLVQLLPTSCRPHRCYSDCPSASAACYTPYQCEYRNISHFCVIL